MSLNEKAFIFENETAHEMRKIELKDFNLYPNNGDTEDTMLEKIEFYTQSFLLKIIEKKLSRELTYIEFNEYLKKKIYIEENILGSKKFELDNEKLLTVEFRMDKDSDFYYQFKLNELHSF